MFSAKVARKCSSTKPNYTPMGEFARNVPARALRASSAKIGQSLNLLNKEYSSVLFLSMQDLLSSELSVQTVTTEVSRSTVLKYTVGAIIRVAAGKIRDAGAFNSYFRVLKTKIFSFVLFEWLTSECF